MKPKKAASTLTFLPLPPGRNPNKHTQQGMGQLDAAMSRQGYVAPMTASADGTVLDGNARLETVATKFPGVEPLVVEHDGTRPVIMVRTDIASADDPLARDIIVSANRVAEVDLAYDLDVLREFAAEGLDLTPYEFDAGMLESITGMVEGQTDPDEVPAERATDIKLGDLFELGNHRLLCGDSMKPEDVARVMGGASATFVLTDPPYGMDLDTDWSGVVGSLKSIGGQRQTKGKKYDRVIGDDAPFNPAHLFVLFGKCREMFLWGADYYAESIPQRADGSWLVWDKRKDSQADAIGSEFELCWSKTKHKRRTLRHDWFGFLSSENGADARNRVHPTQKPVSLMVDILQQWGKPDDAVVDGYGGSGSTLIACQQLERACYLTELAPSYCQVIIDRWEAFTGQKAVKVSGA